MALADVPSLLRELRASYPNRDVVNCPQRTRSHPSSVPKAGLSSHSPRFQLHPYHCHGCQVLKGIVVSFSPLFTRVICVFPVFSGIFISHNLSLHSSSTTGKPSKALQSTASDSYFAALPAVNSPAMAQASVMGDQDGGDDVRSAYAACGDLGLTKAEHGRFCHRH